ncbi:polysaccharide biosynthesis/export family protein [Neptunitalea lumnitzerae]|nr:polysaccharide biosynthesis/export family protein [Neptunitalea sp. Y10]
MKRRFYFLLVVSIFLMQSCVSKKEVVYFQDANESEQAIPVISTKIEPNDILSIQVSAQDPIAAAPYNLGSGNATGGALNNIEILKLNGYLVSPEGMVTLPVLGEYEAKGKNIEEIRLEIENMLIEGGHLVAPTVNVRLLNAKVTVMGEVKVPGTYTFTEQRITLPQALGYAGDLTINGKRDDILIIREEDGKRTMKRIDMTTTDWFNSPYFYIKQNDVIVVSPNNAKVKSAGLIGNAATVLTAVSVMLSAIVIITR